MATSFIEVPNQALADGSIVQGEDTLAPAFELPDRYNTQSLEHLFNLTSDKRGMKSLKKNVGKYLFHYRLMQEAWENIKTSADTINGVRTTSQIKGAQNRKRRTVAQRYFDNLSTADLKRHCTLYNLQFDSYDSIDDAITALIATQTS